MTTRLDLHVHSLGSDGTGTPAQFVEAIQNANLHGIALTDHHNTETPEGEKVRLAIQKAGLLCFRGVEYSTKQGHCLVFGTVLQSKQIGLYPDMQTLIDWVRWKGGVAFPSHPYRGQKEVLGDRLLDLKRLTHVEHLNGQNESGAGFSVGCTPEANQKALRAAERMGLARTGGSDAHQPDRIGTCYTEFEQNIQNEQEFIQALRSGLHTAKANPVLVKAWAGSASKAFTPYFATGSRWFDDYEDRHTHHLESELEIPILDADLSSDVDYDLGGEEKEEWEIDVQHGKPAYRSPFRNGRRR